MEIPALLAALYSAGGGHGDYLWAKGLFPLAMVVPVTFDTAIGWPLVAVALLQFPAYGALVGWATSGPRRLAVVAGTILVVHTAAAAACALQVSPAFE